MSHCVETGLVLLPPMMYGTRQCSVCAIELEHLKLDLDSTYVVSHLPCLRHSVVVVSVTERVGGNSLFVALVDSESVAIAMHFVVITDTDGRAIGVNSLGVNSLGVNIM